MGRKAVSILFYGISVVLTGLLLVAAVLCRNTKKKNRNGFATHFVHYLSDLRVQRYAFQNIFSIFDDQKRRKLE